MYTLSGHTSFVYSLTVLPNGDIASAGEDRTVRVWHGECLLISSFAGKFSDDLNGEFLQQTGSVCRRSSIRPSLSGRWPRCPMATSCQAPATASSGCLAPPRRDGHPRTSSRSLTRLSRGRLSPRTHLSAVCVVSRAKVHRLHLTFLTGSKLGM